MPCTAAPERSLGLIAESVAWEAHFQGWVERFLIAGEVEAARLTSAPPDPAATYRAAMELTQEHIHALRRPVALPAGMQPRLAARGLSETAIAAARLYTKGDLEGALEAVTDPALARDPDALHLRAELLDEKHLSAPAVDRMEVITAYRLALSFERSHLQAARARLRIAQIYLDLGFFREAAATLRPHLDPGLPAPYRVPSVLTFAEAASNSRDFVAALAALQMLPEEQLRGRTRPWVLRKLADISFATEDYAQAAEYYDRYVELTHPGSGAADLGPAATPENPSSETEEASAPRPARETQALAAERLREDPLSVLRHGFALLASRRLEDARNALELLYATASPDSGPGSDGSADRESEPESDRGSDADSDARSAARDPQRPKAASAEAPTEPDTILALIGLALVQTEFESARLARMKELGLQLQERFDGSSLASLFSVGVLEAQRLQGGTSPPPISVSVRANYETSNPALALLSYRIAVLTGESGADKTTIGRLASLARKVRKGSVKAIIHDELAHRLLGQLRESLTFDRTPDADLLDLVEEELSARQIDENGLLLVLEAFYRDGRVGPCARWAFALREREVRPLRRGLGAWREVQCRRFLDEEPADRKEIDAMADSGTAGPFSLALAALSGEMLIRDGELESAIRTYETALESFAEPRIIGPVMLRLGELHAAAERDGLAERRFVRGLGVTQDRASFADPFRKIGYIGLSRLARRSGDTARLSQLLAPDIPRTEPWWPSAYRFLGARAGAALPASGSGATSGAESESESAKDPFAQGLRVLEAGRRLEQRLSEIVGRAPAAASGTTP